MKSRLLLVLTALFLAEVGVATSTSADDLKDATEIVKRTNIAHYYAGKDGRAVVRMKVVDDQGRERKRQFTVIRKDVVEAGDQLYFVRFDKPSDVRNTTFLVKKHAERDDDRWLYLPGLDLVKRISASDKRTSFVGTHFFYEDISGRHHSQDHHKLIQTTGDTYVIRSVPKKPSSVEFKSYELHVDKRTLLPRKIVYTNTAGKVYRTIETAKVETIQGIPTITRIKVSDQKIGGYTLSEVRSVKYDLGVPENIFLERSLRNPPATYLN